MQTHVIGARDRAIELVREAGGALDALAGLESHTTDCWSAEIRDRIVVECRRIGHTNAEISEAAGVSSRTGAGILACRAFARLGIPTAGSGRRTRVPAEFALTGSDRWGLA